MFPELYMFNQSFKLYSNQTENVLGPIPKCIFVYLELSDNSFLILLPIAFIGLLEISIGITLFN